MNEKNSVDSTMNEKKVWTKPVIEAVDINAAKFQARIGDDGAGTRTRS